MIPCVCTERGQEVEKHVFSPAEVPMVTAEAMARRAKAYMVMMCCGFVLNA